MRRKAAATAASVVVLCVIAAALRWAGRSPLAPPPLTDPGRWGPWLDGRTPVVAAFALVRLVAVAALWYIVAVTFVGAVLRAVGAASLVRAADRVTIGPVRRLLAGSISLGLASSGLIAVAAPALRSPVAATQTTTVQTTTVQTTTVRPPATVTMHRLGPAETVTPPAVVAPLPRAAIDRWTVRPGECFWSIAESVLSERGGRAPTDAEIVPYWQRLIQANRGALVHREDPDLILPGQVFDVPAP